MVERCLAKADIAGSNPVSRSKLKNPQEIVGFSLFYTKHRGDFAVSHILFYTLFFNLIFFEEICIWKLKQAGLRYVRYLQRI